MRLCFFLSDNTGHDQRRTRHHRKGDPQGRIEIVAGVGDQATVAGAKILYREFQNAPGVSPMRYIHQKRLWVAHYLLRSGEDATKVCFGCGYREYSAFYRAYRNFFGYSPRETKKL